MKTLQQWIAYTRQCTFAVQMTFHLSEKTKNETKLLQHILTCLVEVALLLPAAVHRYHS